MTALSSVRVGIVGLGNIGRYHAEQLDQLGADLVGGVDVASEARTRFHEEFGVPAYDDARTLYETADAVIVTTPNKFHEEYAVGALEAGLDVLVEKPLAHTVESAERIAAAATEAEGFCMPGFDKRFANPIEVIKAREESGEFGDVQHVEANYVRRRGIPGRGSWFTSKEVAGGGALIDIGVHAIDLSLYLLGYPDVVEVTGVTRSEFGTREDYAFVEMWGEDAGAENFSVEDSATALVRCADGQTISLEVAWATNRPNNQEYFVRGSEAGALYDKAADELTLYETDDRGVNHLTDSRVTTRSSNTHREEQRAFLTASAEGTAPPTSLEEGLTVQRVVDAIYESSETSEAVSLDDEPLAPEARGD